MHNREERGGLDSWGCPRMVGSEKHWTFCRIYLEGCEIFSSFMLFLFSFNLTISLSLSPDCIRIDCNLSKCLLWLFPVPWFREHALWYDHIYTYIYYNSYIYSAPQLSLFTVAVILLTSIKDKNKNEKPLWQVAV